MRLAALSIIVAIAAIGFVPLLAPPAAAAPAHGLRATYYRTHSHDELDDFELPVPGLPVVGTRIDARIAFGEGVGFTEPQPKWWLGKADAVVWQGNIHLPMAGTYWFATAARNSADVWLGDERVALASGLGGGRIPSADFDYPPTMSRDTYDPLGTTYTVPVTVDGATDLPITVRFAMFNIGGPGFGIDLYWVTPDAPLSAAGRPMAEVVPADALFVEPPSAVAVPVADPGASTVSADVLYAGIAGVRPTLTIRIADAQGHPLAGRRVVVSALTTYGERDVIQQPAEPTDANGVTTAILLDTGTVPHESTYVATDVTDFVTVSAAAHVRFENRVPSLLPDTFAPYYGGEKFQVSPLPLAVGRPVTVSVPITNRTEYEADATIVFAKSGSNIGGVQWQEIGRVAPVNLKPGESRDVSVTWTPTDQQTHLCFQVSASATYRIADGQRLMANTAQAWALPLVAPPVQSPVETLQRNIGPVAPCQTAVSDKGTDDPGLFGLPPNNIRNEAYGVCREYRLVGQPHGIDSMYCHGAPYVLTPGAAPSTEKAPNPRIHGGNDYQSHGPDGSPTPLPFKSPIGGKVILYPNGKTNTIGIKTCDGYEVQFLHASKISVKNGDTIAPNTPLGLTGNKSPQAVGIHLHVQVKDPSGSIVDPNDPSGPLSKLRPCDPTSCEWQGPLVSSRPNEGPKAYGRRTAPLYRAEADVFYERAMNPISPLNGDQLYALLRQFTYYDNAAGAAQRLADDPPSSDFGTVAAPTSDSLAGYIAGLTASWERFQGAQDAGDATAAALQWTAARLYLGRIAELEKAEAATLDRLASTVPPDTASPAEIDARVSSFLAQLRSSGPTAEQVARLQAGGLTSDQIAEATARLLTYVEPGTKEQLQEQLDGDLVGEERPVAQSLSDTLRAAAVEARASATQVTNAVADLETDAATAGRTFEQTYLVGNPGPSKATIELRILPVSLPADWSLTIVDADNQPDASVGGVAPAKPPPVREDVPGRRYRIEVPAGGVVRLATMVRPGPLGRGNVSTWAVEAWLKGNRLGGMVQQLQVPRDVPGTVLPPPAGVAPEPTTTARATGGATAVTAPSTPQAVPISALAALAALGAAGVAVVIVLMRRRRSPG